jgi:hypothetical protein
MVRIAFVLLSSLILYGCGSVGDEDTYIGEYLLQKFESENRIIISKGGKYIHRVEAKGKILSEKISVWDKDESNGDKGITFRAFQLDNQSGGGFWFVVPQKDWLGYIELCQDVEEQICFKKIK